MKIEPHKSSMGMEANLWAMLVYIITMVLGWIPYVNFAAWVFPLIMFYTEKNSGFVMFHAMQAVALYIVNAVLSILFTIISGLITISMVGSIYNPVLWGNALGGSIGLVVVGVIQVIIGIAMTVIAIISLIKAYQYEQYKMPLVGNFAKTLMRKAGM